MDGRLRSAAVTIVAALVSTHALAIGRTPGNFSVSMAGAAQYTIPIATPPGPAGIQPNLALIYSSQSGVGSLGIGWSVAGLGAITRCNKTYAQDTIPAAVALAAADGYCLNGNRLRLTGGTYGAAGSTYQTEIADFSNVTANGSTANGTTADTGPAYFTVQGRDGLTYQYGYTDANGNGANSQVLATGTTTADYWLLSKVIDRYGNNYVVNYTSATGGTTPTGMTVPSTILWTPTSAGATTYAYKLTFNYTTNVPQSSLTKYVSGTAVSNTQLLQSISIAYSGAVVKEYFLTYQASPTTGRNELITIKECADAAQTNCLLPTQVGYQNGAQGLATTSTSALPSTGPGLTARYDLNGDGIPDLLYTNNNAWYVSFGTGTGYGPATLISAGVYLIGNVTGGSEDGILTVVNGTWWYYLWNGSTFTGTSAQVKFDSASQYQLADVNGDGLPDLVGLYPIAATATAPAKMAPQFHLNTSAGGIASFSSTLSPTSFTLPATALLYTPDTQFGSLRRFDFDGDGRDDLVAIYATGTAPNVIVHTVGLLSTGTAFTEFTVSNVSGNTYLPVFFANWNDDACTDFVSNGTLYLSGCNGTTPATFPVGNVVAAMDWDGDGRTDVVVSNGTTLGVYLSTGSGVGTTPLSTTIPYSATCEYVTMDVKGVGLDDLGCWSQTLPGPLTYYLHNGAGQIPDLATSFTDGYGNSAKPTYVALPQSFTPNGDPSVTSPTTYLTYPLGSASYPYMNYIGPMEVVSHVVYSDPSSATAATYTRTYYYDNAWMNLQGRGFAGFGQTNFDDSRTGWRVYAGTQQSFPYTGMPGGPWFTDPNGSSVFQRYHTLNVTTLDATANNQRYFPYFSDILEYYAEIQPNSLGWTATKDAAYTYDNYGNATNVTTTWTDTDATSPFYNDTWVSTMVNTVTPDTTTWCLGLPTQITVTNSSTTATNSRPAAGGGAITRTIAYNNPDYTHCRQTEKVVEPSSAAYKVVYDYVYDTAYGNFGNLHSTTVTGAGMTPRVTTLTWTANGQFPLTITNPLSQSITLGFDPVTGLKTSQTDLNYTTATPNDLLLTKWLYDAFGRKTQETRPDKTYSTWVYNDCAALTGGCPFGSHAMAVSHYNYNTDNTIESSGTTYYDTVDRSVISTTLTLAGGFTRNEVRYDPMGHVAKQAMPCAWTNLATACPYWTTTLFDVLNRPTSIQRPISATDAGTQTTTFNYAGRLTTITDPTPNKSIKRTLVTGPLASSQDANGYTQNFEYDAFGSLLSVTDSSSPSNTLFSATYGYGIKAFQKTTSDMDMGGRVYSVDSLGELMAYTDANNKSFSFTYDVLSRPQTRTEPDMTTTWTWGTSATLFNIGKLQSVASTVAGATTYSEAYTYDSLTRPSVKTITIPPDPAYSYTSTYSMTTGLLASLAYPALTTPAYQLKVNYNVVNGYLQSIADATSGVKYWTANSINPRGQVTEATLGNGVVINRGFDAVTGWMSTSQAGLGSGSGLQNLAYTFDEVGNLKTRQDLNQALTESFNYDSVYRLLNSTLSGTTNLAMTYDVMGDITSRSDVNAGVTWTYDPVHKHQVTSAGTGFAFTYDANGNMLTGRGGTMTWYSYNLPNTIINPYGTTQFFYGPNHQYYKQIEGGPKTTLYIGGLLEKVSVTGGYTEYRHKIQTDGAMIEVDETTGTNSNIYYVTQDHLGSSAVITNSTGVQQVSESFNAWGSRRGSNWQGSPSAPDNTAIANTTSDGFTGHTMLDSVKMIHMNGRVYDRVIGRFISADPTTADPGNTQAWNRYSYANNNPLSSTDPTGFSRVPYCGSDWCPGPNYHAGPYANAGFGNSGDGALNWLPANDITGSNDFAPGGPFAPFTGPDLAPTNNASGGATNSDPSATPAEVVNGNSDLGNALRGIPLVGGILGAAGDILSGLGNIGFGAISFNGDEIASGFSELGGGIGSVFQIEFTDLAAGLVGAAGYAFNLGANTVDVLSLGNLRSGGNMLTALGTFVQNTIIPDYALFGGPNWGVNIVGPNPQYAMNSVDYFSEQHDVAFPGQANANYNWVQGNWAPTPSGLVPPGPLGIAYVLLGTLPFGLSNPFFGAGH